MFLNGELNLEFKVKFLEHRADSTYVFVNEVVVRIYLLRCAEKKMKPSRLITSTVEQNDFRAQQRKIWGYQIIPVGVKFVKIFPES